MKTTMKEVKEEVVRCRIAYENNPTPELHAELSTARLLHDVIEEGTSMGVKQPKDDVKQRELDKRDEFVEHYLNKSRPAHTQYIPPTHPNCRSTLEPIVSVPEIPIIDLRPKKRKQMRKLLWWVIIINVLVLISILLCSCKAVQGIGQDITWAGGAGEKFLEYREK